MNKRTACGALLLLAFFLAPTITRARDYSANTGRFMTMDTFAGNQQNPQTLHKYIYAANNPVNRIDPSGHEDIAGVLTSMSIGIALASMPNLSPTPRDALSSGSTVGPDVTTAVMHTMNDVEQTFLRAPPAVQGNAAALTYTPQMYNDGWDIGPLNELAHGGKPIFGNGSMLGSGLGLDTVQFSFGGNTKAYHAGSVNYILWGRMFCLMNNTFHNPAVGDANSSFSESAAVSGANIHKFLLGDLFNSYGEEAAAFVRFGYSGTDPSSTALPLKPNSGNVGASPRFPWKWIGLHDFVQ